ncbi:MAG: hypothetical protein WDN31_00175 [Hyphomicrobium sp.]
MRGLFASALIVGLALTMGAQSAEAGRSYRQYRGGGDCTPTNGPFGFYGNLWCKPTESQYLRNLGAQWPQETPRSLRYPKPTSNYTW